uniref:Uncharacterized protein n=1 Tax=Amazona collaria TaxID=241587 RepID=A0A8B9G8M4_9PSIT
MEGVTLGGDGPTEHPCCGWDGVGWSGRIHCHPWAERGAPASVSAGMQARNQGRGWVWGCLKQERPRCHPGPDPSLKPLFLSSHHGGSEAPRGAPDSRCQVRERGAGRVHRRPLHLPLGHCQSAAAGRTRCAPHPCQHPRWVPPCPPRSGGVPWGDAGVPQIQGEVRIPRTVGAVEYRGVFGTLSTMVRMEGPRSLYSGLAAGLQRQMSFASIRIGLYDSVKQLYTPKGAESECPGAPHPCAPLVPVCTRGQHPPFREAPPCPRALNGVPVWWGTRGAGGPSACALQAPGWPRGCWRAAPRARWPWPVPSPPTWSRCGSRPMGRCWMVPGGTAAPWMPIGPSPGRRESAGYGEGRCPTSPVTPSSTAGSSSRTTSLRTRCCGRS